ncbi:hypothetical protein EZV62_009083 [Acer yangbiense]|uniref:Uncharacterized protein n=1 Tax=Acer yangbiense TaxID=1000413 RepID=A0A5C7IFJ0_9ROSI|nr:hypothetical protein EZV62_009083 [Acer yangbiense]
MEMLEVVVAFLCFFILSYWMKNKNSPPITDWPIVGMLPGLLLNVQRFHEYVTEALIYGSGVLEFKGAGWSPYSDFVFTSDPMNVNHILTKNFANYPKGSEGSDFREILEPLGDGIFRTDSDVWKAQRKLMLSAMHDKRFKLFSEKCTWQKVEKGLIPVLEHVSKLGMEVDLNELFKRFTFDVVGLLVFGFDSNSLSVEFPVIPHEKAFDNMEKAFFNRSIMPKSYWKLLKWLQIGEEKKLKEACEIFDRFLYQRISAAREKLILAEEEEEFTLLSAFLADQRGQTDDYTSENSNKILRDHAFNLMAAGRDTVSSVLSWFFWFVATNASIETKILEEIKEKHQEKVVGKLRFFSAEELNSLVYLHATLCETLRLYPPVPFNLKTAAETDVLPSGHQVPQNTRMFISFYSMGRMHEIWGQDCLEFKPERWITKQGGIMHVPSYKFTAFNAGPRSCVGKDMSFIQMKIIAVSLIWNYHLQLVEGHPVTPKNSVVLHMKYGLKVKGDVNHTEVGFRGGVLDEFFSPIQNIEIKSADLSVESIGKKQFQQTSQERKRKRKPSAKLRTPYTHPRPLYSRANPQMNHTLSLKEFVKPGPKIFQDVGLHEKQNQNWFRQMKSVHSDFNDTHIDCFTRLLKRKIEAASELFKIRTGILPTYFFYFDTLLCIFLSLGAM